MLLNFIKLSMFIILDRFICDSKYLSKFNRCAKIVDNENLPRA